MRKIAGIDLGLRVTVIVWLVLTLLACQGTPPPTNTPVATASPTHTVVPTETSTNTLAPTATETHTPLPTDTLAPTLTPAPTDTPEPTVVASNPGSTDAGPLTLNLVYTNDTFGELEPCG